MRDPRPVQAVLLNRGDIEPRLTTFDVQRTGDTDSPLLAPMFPVELTVTRLKLTVRTTKDPFQDGKVIYNNEDESWDLWLWHPMPIDAGEDKYVVYYNKSQAQPDRAAGESFSLRHDIVVFRQALNRPGLTLVSVKWREDKWGLYGVF